MKEAPKTEPAASAEPAPKTPLVEFCMRLSGRDRRVEMIAGFEHVEKLAGRLADTEQAYAARFEAFVTQPA
jgi:hypothetical protein